MKDAAILIQNVSKNFKLPNERFSSLKSRIIHPFRARGFSVQHALHDIDLEIKKGEFFGIVGRNGSGKSTLLKIIAGIYQPTKGRVVVSGKLVPFIELGVGFNPELTGRQNVYLNGALLGFSEQEIDAMYDDIVEFAELEQHMDQKLKNYSSGMQVRLAFSMAVRAKADVLLIDEVLAVGDADFQRKCFNYFHQLKKEKTTVIFVSHNMDAIREYCDRAVLIEDSRMVVSGSTDIVSEKYMQLFMGADAGGGPTSTGEDRWGDGIIKATKINVKVTSDEIIINETVEATKPVERPIPGFRIKDAAGNHVLGTNTKIEKIVVPNFSAGEKVNIVWRMSNCLSDGDYYIDPAILHHDEITVADWWNEAVRFTVKKSRHLPYPVDPGFDIEINKANK